MRIRNALVTLVTLTGFGLAFDPIGPPPDWTITQICSHLSKNKIPGVSFSGASLSELLEVLTLERPKGYTPRYQADETLLRSSRTFSFEQKEDITPLELISKIAETFEADVLITRGIVRFQSRPPLPKSKNP